MPVDDPTGPVLDIRGLSIDFATPRGPVHAVRGVDLAIGPNKAVGIVGESGCGKSTIALAAMRLLASNARVTHGEIRLGGRDLLSMSPSTLRSVRGHYASMIFQDPMTAQNPVLSVARQMIDIQYRDTALGQVEKRRRAVEMLARVGIPDAERRLDSFPHEFSGGMRQRISIAMTLLMRPRLVIADEPTTALDVNTEAQIAFLLRRLQRETGISLLFVSHNLGLIAELCDEVVVMYAGEIVEQATATSLFHSPKHPYTQKLLECDPALALKRTRRLATIPGRVPDLRRRPVGCVFADRCHKVFERCEDEAPQIQRLGPAHTARCHLLAQPRTQTAQSPVRRPLSEEDDAAERIDGTLLSIANLRVRFRTEGPIQALLRGRRDPFLDAVVNVSLQLRRGETLGLVGESGSGKTTLGRTIAGLLRPQAGSIRFDDTELVGLSRAKYNLQRRKLSMIFQDPVASLSPRQTARALVMEPFEIHRIALADARAKAEELFSMVGLSSAFFQRYPHELSGGQARRVSVARALALSPKLVIADEPTAGLDVSVQGEILNLLGDLQRQAGLSYLIISHNLPAIRHISDRIGVMYLGRLVEQAPTDALFAAPAHPYTRALLEGIPQPDPDRRRNSLPVEGEVPSLAERPRGCEFHPRCPFATDRCRSEAPRDQSIGPYRWVRCHYPLTNSFGAK